MVSLFDNDCRDEILITPKDNTKIWNNYKTPAQSTPPKNWKISIAIKTNKQIIKKHPSARNNNNNYKKNNKNKKNSKIITNNN